MHSIENPGKTPLKRTLGVDYDDPKLRIVGRNFNICTTPMFWAVAENAENQKFGVLLEC